LVILSYFLTAVRMFFKLLELQLCINLVYATVFKKLLFRSEVDMKEQIN